MNTVLHENARLKQKLRQYEEHHAKLRSAVIEKLEALEHEADTEKAHCEGDKLISKFLRDTGHIDVANAFDAARQDWYYG